MPTVLRSERRARPRAGAAWCRNASSRSSVASVSVVCSKRRASRPTTSPSASRGTARQTFVDFGNPRRNGSCVEKISSWSRAIALRSRTRSCASPTSRGIDRRRIFSRPLPWTPMHRKSGCTVSGAQSNVPSAPVMDALQRAAQPDVWERFSQSASSASAEISVSPETSSSAGSSVSSSGDSSVSPSSESSSSSSESSSSSSEDSSSGSTESSSGSSGSSAMNRLLSDTASRAG